MNSQNNQKQEFQVNHIHYHYHYYNPEVNNRTFNTQRRQKKTVSEVNTPINRLHLEQSTRERKDIPKTTYECDNAANDDSFRKKRNSDHSSQSFQNRLVYSRQTQFEVDHHQGESLTIDQINQFEINDHQKQNRHCPEIDQSFGTKASEQEQRSLIRFETELQWYKKEVDRLKSIEEECIYLRQQCLKHYQKCLQRK